MSKPVHYHLGNFPPKNIDWESLAPFIGKAGAALGRYDGLVAVIPSAKILLSPLVTQEAVLSSKIEGTKITMSEVLEIEAGGKPASQSQRHEAEEVINYRSALNFAAESIKTQPLSMHTLRQAHELLMDGVRGRNKNPGAIRTTQNWIGTPDSTMKTASFVPIPPEQLQNGLDIWSKYLLSQNEPDPLVQLAISHLEFEALHPFDDGNGRLGRMAIPLFLAAHNILSRPNFYMSGYLETHRDQYIDTMQAVSREGKWTQWCVFFLKGIIEQASENQDKAQKILTLHSDMMTKVRKTTRSKYSSLAVDFMFSEPIFPTTLFVKNAGIPRATALRILKILGHTNILNVIRTGKGRQSGIWFFPELINVTEGKIIF